MTNGKRADSLNEVELRVHRPKNFEVQVVSEVRPNTDEERKEELRPVFADVVDALGELSSAGFRCTADSRDEPPGRCH